MPEPNCVLERSMSNNKSTVDPKLLEILVCPLTKSPLSYNHQTQELISEQAGLAYPIRDGIPIMLIDEARQIGNEDENSDLSSCGHE